MRLQFLIELGDRLVFQEGRGTAYREFWERPFRVVSTNISELGVRFEDTQEYRRISRNTITRVCRPLDFPDMENWSLR